MTFAVCFRPHGAVPRTSFCRGQGHCVSLSIIYIYLYFSLRSCAASGTLRGCGPCLSPSQAGVPPAVPPGMAALPMPAFPEPSPFPARGVARQEGGPPERDGEAVGNPCPGCLSRTL